MSLPIPEWIRQIRVIGGKGHQLMFNFVPVMAIDSDDWVWNMEAHFARLYKKEYYRRFCQGEGLCGVAENLPWSFNGLPAYFDTNFPITRPAERKWHELCAREICSIAVSPPSHYVQILLE
jgi:hypothetical protein